MNPTFNLPEETAHELVSFQVPTADNNYTWYRLYSDGWCEQGCDYIAPGGTWNFPISMLNDKYTAVMSYKTSSSSNPPQWQYMWTGKYSDHILIASSGLHQSIFVCGYAQSVPATRVRCIRY